MDGLTLIHEAESAGLKLEAKGDRLIIRGPKDAVGIVRKISKHKREVLDALNPDWAADARKLIGWCADPAMRQDLMDRYEERAAIFEFMQGHSTHGAEMLAFGDLLVELLRLGIDRPHSLDHFQEPHKPTD